MRRIIPASRLAAVAAVAVAVVVVGGTGALAGSTINGDTLSQNSVDSSEVQANSLTGKDVRNSTLTGADIANETITGTDVDNGTLTGADIRDGTLATNDLAPGSINDALIGANQVGASEVKSDSLTGAEIRDHSITDADLDPAFGDALLERLKGGSGLDTRGRLVSTWAGGQDHLVIQQTGTFLVTLDVQSTREGPVKVEVGDAFCVAVPVEGVDGAQCSATRLIEVEGSLSVGGGVDLEGVDVQVNVVQVS